jgi:hypothetical protein
MNIRGIEHADSGKLQQFWLKDWDEEERAAEEEGKPAEILASNEERDR